MKKAVKIVVTGKVQGVFYRVSAKAVADQLGIKGTVKNDKDSSVIIHAEGEAVFLDHFTDWCKDGPDEARVDGIEISDAILQNHLNFDIIKK